MLESAQRELVRVLLDRIRSLGLISSSTCSRAVELVYSAADFPNFFQHPEGPDEEADGHECIAGTP